MLSVYNRNIPINFIEITKYPEPYKVITFKDFEEFKKHQFDDVWINLDIYSISIWEDEINIFIKP